MQGKRTQFQTYTERFFACAKLALSYWRKCIGRPTYRVLDRNERSDPTRALRLSHAQSNIGHLEDTLHEGTYGMAD